VVNEVFCDGLGACIGACPTGALEIVEREADEFDEQAVEKSRGNFKAPQPNRSELAQWPIQLRLLPTSGPLYQDRELLLLADCTAAAYPDLHRGLIAGRTVIMSCPKLDDPEESIAKLAAIFRNPIPSVSVAIMEVPCCSGLVRITQEAMRRAGTSHPIEVVRIGIRGDLLERFPV